MLSWYTSVLTQKNKLSFFYTSAISMLYTSVQNVPNKYTICLEYVQNMSLYGTAAELAELALVNQVD